MPESEKGPIVISGEEIDEWADNFNPERRFSHHDIDKFGERLSRACPDSFSLAILPKIAEFEGLSALNLPQAVTLQLLKRERDSRLN